MDIDNLWLTGRLYEASKQYKQSLTYQVLTIPKLSAISNIHLTWSTIFIRYKDLVTYRFSRFLPNINYFSPNFRDVFQNVHIFSYFFIHLPPFHCCNLDYIPNSFSNDPLFIYLSVFEDIGNCRNKFYNWVIIFFVNYWYIYTCLLLV